jgi:hypothetical protein
MSTVDIRLILDGGQIEHGMHCYQPGSVVSGAVHLMPARDVQCDRAIAKIGWRTEGRGDRDSANIGEVELYRGPLSQNIAVSGRFEFALPDQPLSYVGHYINIIWEIAVVVDVPFARDIKQAEQIVVVP